MGQEHNKLRARLKNIGRNTTEYRMTIAEAKALLEEYDNKVDLPTAVLPVVEEQEVHVRILDGGSF